MAGYMRVAAWCVLGLPHDGVAAGCVLRLCRAFFARRWPNTAVRPAGQGDRHVSHKDTCSHEEGAARTRCCRCRRRAPGRRPRRPCRRPRRLARRWRVKLTAAVEILHRDYWWLGRRSRWPTLVSDGSGAVRSDGGGGGGSSSRSRSSSNRRVSLQLQQGLSIGIVAVGRDLARRCCRG